MNLTNFFYFGFMSVTNESDGGINAVIYETHSTSLYLNFSFYILPHFKHLFVFLILLCCHFLHYKTYYFSFYFTFTAIHFE